MLGCEDSAKDKHCANHVSSGSLLSSTTLPLTASRMGASVKHFHENFAYEYFHETLTSFATHYNASLKLISAKKNEY
jgi:hypothetical protein